MTNSAGSSPATPPPGGAPDPLARLAVLLLRFYKRFLSPLMPVACRYTPTCSVYAREAFERHGVLRGARLTFLRLLRCQPWGGSGEDPVPAS